MSRNWNPLNSFNGNTAMSAVTGEDGMDSSSPFEQFCALSRIQRLYGFVGCFAVGLVLSILSTITLLTFNLVGFAILYTIGIVVSLVGTGFLVGFLRQLKLMFKPVRLFATIIFLVSVVLCIVFAVVIGNFVLTLIFVIIEFLAYAWYCASYIPYGRAMIKKVCGGLVEV